jgi:hypothetical protein
MHIYAIKNTKYKARKCILSHLVLCFLGPPQHERPKNSFDKFQSPLVAILIRSLNQLLPPREKTRQITNEGFKFSTTNI